MKRYKTWTIIMNAVAIVALAAGCGMANNGAADTGAALTSNAMQQPGVNGAGRTGSASPGSTNAGHLRSTVVMPKPQLWNRTTSTANSAIQTPYGTITFSTHEMTKNDVSVFLTSVGRKSILYRFHHSGYKHLDGWQRQGRYLALRFGLPPSAHPSTGDYGYEEVVLNLHTRNMVVALPSTVQSNDYLSNPYFAQSVIRTENGVLQSVVHVVRLVKPRQLSFALPHNALGLGIVSNGRLYYEAVNGTSRSVASIVLPHAGWRPMTDPAWHPIHLSPQR